jgi:hypothetical protein
MGNREVKNRRLVGTLCIGLILVLALWVFSGIILGRTAPFGMSYKADHPWVDVISGEEHDRVESFIRDPILQTWPFIHYMHESIRNGDFPLWNIDQFSGTPFIANRCTGLLNPLVLIPTAIFEPVTAQSVIYFFHFLMAGIFFFLFIRELKLDSPVALFGSIAYMLQGAYIPWGGISSSDAAYFPMVMYFLERMLNRKDKVGIIGFIFSFYLLSITGYPQIVIYTIYIIIAWILFSRSGGIKVLGKRTLAVGIMLGIALMISAMQSLPTVEFYMQSPRTTPEYQQALASANVLEVMDSPVTLIRYFFPKMWGDYISDREIFYPEIIVKTYIHGYLGILAAFAALFFPLVYRNRRARFFSILFLIGCLFIAWNQLFIVVAGILPGLRISSIKPHFITNIAIIITACYVINHLITNLKINERLSKKLERVNFWLLSGVVGLVFVIIIYSLKLYPVTSLDHSRTFQMISGIFILFIATLVLRQFTLGRINAGLTYTLIVIITLIDLVPYQSHIMIQVPRNRAIWTTQGIEFLQDRMETEGPFRIFRNRKRKMLPANSTTLLGLQEMGGFIPMVVGDYSNYFASINPAMTRNRQVIDSPPDMELFSEPFWDFLNVKYFVSPDEIDLPDEKWLIVYNDEMVIYENQDCLPRWYCVSDVFNVDSIEDAFNFSREIDPAETAIVNVDVVVDISRAPEPPGWEPPEPGTVDLVSYTSDEVILDVESDSGTYLVFSDTYYPGWRAWIDGKPAEISRTNGIIKGIWVPEGRHTVRFLYDPLSYKIGWALAILGLMLIPLAIKPVRKLLENDV